jgi:hypothetical protein
MDSLPVFSPKGCVAMKLVASFLVLLALIALLAIHRKGLTADEAAEEGVGVVVRLEDDVFRDEYRTVATLAVIAMFAFVMWTVLRAKKEADKTMPLAKESRANNKTLLR